MSPRGGELLRHRDFQKLWAGQTVSQLGSQVSQLALPLVAVLVLHVSAFYVALLGTVDLLPFLLFALPAGVWLDRIPRRPVMIVADVGRCIALASIPLVAGTGASPSGSSRGRLRHRHLHRLLRRRIPVVPAVARRPAAPGRGEREARAEPLGGADRRAGLGGVLVGAITAPYAILVDSVSFAVSALLLGRIRRREPRPEPSAAPNMWAELMEGLRYLLGTRAGARSRCTSRRSTSSLGHLLALRRLRGPAARAVAGRDRTRVRAREPGLAARRRRRRGERPARHRLDTRVRSVHRRGGDAAHPARTGELRDSVSRHLGRDHRARNRAVQRDRDQPDPDADPGPAARARQRVPALDRVGRSRCRSRRSISRSTRSTTAPNARPAGASSRTGGCPGSSARTV